MNPERDAVCGTGAMGSGIVQVLAEIDHEVVVTDKAFAKSPDFLRTSKEKVLLGLFWRKIGEGKDAKFAYRTREAVHEIFNRIKWCGLDSDEFKTLLGSCDAVIEAIEENIDKKKELYAYLEKYIGSDALILTNTSVIQIKKLAEGMKHPGRFMGMHFFNPVPVMKPVELITYKDSTLTAELVLKLAHKLGKEVIFAPDRVGFIVNGCAVPLIMVFDEEVQKGADFKAIDKAFTGGTWIDFPPARRIVEYVIEIAKDIVAEGRVTKENVDKIMRLGLNWRYGPLEIEKMIAEGRAKEVVFPMGPGRLCDHVGIDVALNCCEMFKAQEPDKWSIPETLKKLLAEGKKGKKNGIGFYEYKDEATFEMAPDKSYALIGWTGKVLSLDIIKGIKEKFEFARSLGIKTIILRIFHANGADITEFSLCLVDEGAGKYAINTWHSLIDTIVNYPGIVVAAVEGRAFGGAYELALACDRIVAGKKSTEHVVKNLGRYAALPKRDRSPIDFSLNVKKYLKKFKFRELLKNYCRVRSLKKEIGKEIEDARAYWKGAPPESFELAVRVIVEGNQKPFMLGLVEEWKAITASFATKSAQENIRLFLEGEKLIDPPKGTSVGLPEATLGIMPGGGGTQTLPRLVRLPLGLRMILRGQIVLAEPPYVDEILVEQKKPID